MILAFGATFRDALRLGSRFEALSIVQQAPVTFETLVGWAEGRGARFGIVFADPGATFDRSFSAQEKAAAIPVTGNRSGQSNPPQTGGRRAGGKSSVRA